MRAWWIERAKGRCGDKEREEDAIQLVCDDVEDLEGPSVAKQCSLVVKYSISAKRARTINYLQRAGAERPTGARRGKARNESADR